MTHTCFYVSWKCLRSAASQHCPGALSAVGTGRKTAPMIMEGSAVVEGESVLLQALLLSQRDHHLGTVSRHMAQVSAVSAQGRRGDQL